MIGRAELLRLASELGLTPQVVEKDYVLGWVLAGIAHDPLLSESWVFKGGTCLKKCWFETYRFSEDLDFTLTEPGHLDEAFLLERFAALDVWLHEATGVELPPDLLRFKTWQTARGSRAGEGRIAYRGPIAPRGGDLPRIRIDLTADETLVLAPVVRPVSHPYSDEPSDGIHALCYAFEELFGEKVRALGERCRPRDLYDVVHLFRDGALRARASAVREVIERKCAFKGIPLPSLVALAAARDELAGDWTAMLGHQLPALPPMESFWAVLPAFFDWLGGKAAPVTAAAYPSAPGDTVLRAPVGALVGPSLPLVERIRFAGANRLCVELDYVDEQGRRRTRLVEPYALRRTRSGDTVLSAVRVEDHQDRSYRIDRMRDARITERPFQPRYAIELVPAPSLPIQPLPEMGRSTAKHSPTRSMRPATAGAVNVFSCPSCGRTFRRNGFDSRLRPHKTRAGHDCPGRAGRFVRSER
jgi:predicted nucleotidyltransferase component of viral defense system